MAVSSPDRRRRLAPPPRPGEHVRGRAPAAARIPLLAAAFAVAMAGALAALLPAAPAWAQQQEIQLDAAHTDFDRRNERLLFDSIRIQQGPLVVTADRAEARDLDFERGSWQFEGNVRISNPQTTLESERAIIYFADHRLTRAVAEGDPARFTRVMPDPEESEVQGTANRIDYDLEQGELTLAGQAALRDEQREVSGARLVYRIEDDRLIASADEEGDERVRITITPPRDDNGDDNPDDGQEEAPPQEDGGGSP